MARALRGLRACRRSNLRCGNRCRITRHVRLGRRASDAGAGRLASRHAQNRATIGARARLLLGAQSSRIGLAWTLLDAEADAKKGPVQRYRNSLLFAGTMMLFLAT